MIKTLRTFVLLMPLLAPGVAYADSERGPSPYAQPTSNGIYLFVMLVPGETVPNEIPLWDPARGTVATIPARFPSSGLYLNDGSTAPLWTVDWYAHGVTVLSDGIHLIRRGPWAEDLSDEALSFFANGKLLRSYRINDFVDTSIALPHTVSHFMWEDDRVLDESNHTLVLTTLSKEVYTFDYTKGRIVSARRPLRAIVAVGLAIVLFLVLRRWL